jgi:hypothetical protein
MTKILWALPLLLAACQQREAATSTSANEVMVRSAAQQQLFELNDLDRVIALKRAIQAQGLRCGQMTRTGYVGRFKEMDVWTATCNDGRDWALFIGADDSVQVRLCKDNVQLGLPACVIEPGTEGGAGLENMKVERSGTSN